LPIHGLYVRGKVTKTEWTKTNKLN